MLKKQLKINYPGPACSAQHIPGYIGHKSLKDAGDVYVISVNDAFVYVFRWSTPSIATLLINHSMKAWGDSLESGEKSGVSKHGQASQEYTPADQHTTDSLPGRSHGQVHRSS